MPAAHRDSPRRDRLLDPSKQHGCRNSSQAGEWIRHRPGSQGIELLEAAFERHVYDRHIHDTFAIGFTLRGVQRFWCRGATHDSTPGDVIAINPGEAHDGRSGAAGGYAYRMFYVSIDTARHIVEDALEGPAANIDSQAPRLTNPVLSRRLNTTWKAMSCSATSLATEELLRQALIFLTARHAGRHVDPRVVANEGALRQVRDYLHDSVEHPVTLGELAAIASMSRFQLTRQFQKAFGLPLHAYHLHVRLEEAKRRLRLNQPIATVAIDLGFVDQSHFHRRFKGSFGLTPGEWRRSAMAR